MNAQLRNALRVRVSQLRLDEILARQDRACPECHEPLPEDAPSYRKYCSEVCAARAHRDMQRRSQ